MFCQLVCVLLCRILLGNKNVVDQDRLPNVIADRNCATPHTSAACCLRIGGLPRLSAGRGRT